MYGAGLFITVVLVLMYLFRNTLFPDPTCFDGKQNGFESGVDCGGVCSLQCTQDVIPLAVIWSRAIPISDTEYDFIALISNKNVDNAPRALPYTFTAYNKSGGEMISIHGTTTVPIDGDFPIVVQRIALKEAPYEISLRLNSNIPHYKVLEKPTSPTLRVISTRYEVFGISRVYATLTSTKRTLLRDLPVRVFLYDAEGNVFAGGETVVPIFEKEGTKEIVFTWGSQFPTPPAKIQVFPILDPFLGSL